jgi:hypothetical protein
MNSLPYKQVKGEGKRETSCKFSWGADPTIRARSIVDMQHPSKMPDGSSNLSVPVSSLRQEFGYPTLCFAGRFGSHPCLQAPETLR